MSPRRASGRPATVATPPLRACRATAIGSGGRPRPNTPPFPGRERRGEGAVKMLWEETMHIVIAAIGVVYLIMLFYLVYVLLEGDKK